MIKLIATDVDGTLVEEGTPNLNPEVLDTIVKLKQKGILFAAASGRQYASMYRLFEPVADHMIFIAENGGYVVCRGRQIECRSMKREILEKLVSFMREQTDCFLLVNTPCRAYTETRDPDFVESLRRGYKLELEETEDVLALEEPIVKAAIYCRQDQDPVEVARQAGELFRGELNVMAAGAHWGDFVGTDTDKGKALESIQRLMHITKEETMAFGDNNNDIGMMLCAGESYAVANAREEVKKAARHLTDRNVDDGVLKILKRLL